MCHANRGQGVFHRHKSVLTLLAGVMLAVVPAIAMASEGGGGGRPLYDLIMRFVNFAILMGALIYFTRKPIVNGIRNSIESVRKMLADAEVSRKEAEAGMKEAEDRLANVDEEVKEIIAHAHEESRVEKERTLEEAREAVEKLKKEAAIAIEQELKKSQATLREEIAEKAIALAEEIIRKNVKAEDHSKFVNEYLEKLEAN